jgi:hypothetical protein
MKEFLTELGQMQTDLNSYRKFSSELKKVALWPKQLSEVEIQAIKDKVSSDIKTSEQGTPRDLAVSTQRSKSTPKAKDTPRAQSSTSQTRP